MDRVKAAAGVDPGREMETGRVHEAGEVCRLRKGSHAAVCSSWTRPIGAEARVTLDGELNRSEAKRDGAALVDLALDWKTQFQAKGWTSAV